MFGNAALAAAWGVAELPALTTPGAGRRDTVYLDVWEREVDAAEDADLINSSIGLETCVRDKREWVVRVAEGADSPPAAPAGHVFYPLATLERPADAAAILPPHIADRRLTGLTISSWKDIRQITRDAFGDGYTLDQDGEPNLKVPLREAINAVLRGGIPMTAPASVTTHAHFDSQPVVVRDDDGDIWVFWRSNRSANGDIYSKRYLSAAAVWEGEARLVSSTGFDRHPRVVVGNDGDLWLFWESNRDGNYDIWTKRYSRANRTWGDNEKVSTHTANDYQPAPVVDNAGNVWVFWYSSRDGNQDIFSRRFDRLAGAWDPVFRVTTDVGSDYTPHAVVGGPVSDIWVFWRSNRGGNSDIYARRFRFTAGTWANELRLTSDAALDTEPNAAVAPNGDIWLFYRSFRGSDNNIWYRRFQANQGFWANEVQLTTARYDDFRPVATAASNGDIWVTWTSARSGSNNDIWYNRYSHTTGWAGNRALTTDTREDSESWLTEDGTGDVWVVWRSYRRGNSDIWYRRLVPEI